MTFTRFNPSLYYGLVTDHLRSRPIRSVNNPLLTDLATGKKHHTERCGFYFVATERSGADIRALFKSRVFAERISALKKFDGAERISRMRHGAKRSGYPPLTYFTDLDGSVIRCLVLSRSGAVCQSAP